MKIVIKEAEFLTKNGAKEIILLGQNVNAYQDGRNKLSNLIIELEKISEIQKNQIHNISSKRHDRRFN